MFASSVRKSQRGFTLVELLIVVAIIGVLATLGVPTFKRMVQKSKKAEAKVNLGALYTAEQAFTAEYSVFGNNLAKVGFQIDGSAAANATNMTYLIGFPGTVGCAGSSTIAPLQSNTQGTALNSAYPSYYTGALSTVVGYTSLASNCTSNASYDVTAIGDQFVAVAQGVIAPGYDRTTAGGNSANLDIWTMDYNRNLANIQDGVQ